MPIEPAGKNNPISKLEFHLRLLRWLAETDESIIGDPYQHPMKGWVFVRDRGVTYKLNGDSTRQGVTEYLVHVIRHGSGLEWHPTLTTKGNMNAVAYGPDKAPPVSGFFFYLSDQE